MKKQIYLLLTAFSIFAVASCGSSQNSSVQNSNLSNNEYSSYQENFSSDLELLEDECKVIIDYKYANGNVFKTVSKKLNFGEECSFESPKVDFMVPNYESIDIVANEKVINREVIYSYIGEPINVIKGQNFTKVMVDYSKGISFSYIVSNLTSYEKVILEGNSFKINSGSLSIKGISETTFVFSDALKINNSNGNSWFSGINNEALMTVSIGADKSVDIYKNGMKIYSFSSIMESNDKLISDFVDSLYYSVSQMGFSLSLLGQHKIRDLSVNYAFDEKDAAKYYKNYVHTQIKFVDEFDNELTEQISVYDYGNQFYSFDVPKIDGYKVDLEKIEFQSKYINETKIVRYRFDGTERLTQEIINQGKNKLILGGITKWSDSSLWYKIRENISGDFLVRVNYTLNGATSYNTCSNGGEICWRTTLAIIYDSSTQDRWVTRLDWHGWQDNVNGDSRNLGSSTNHSSSYVDNYDFDLFNIFSDCEVTQIYQRTGSSISIKTMLRPNKPGYRGSQYEFTYSLNGVSASKISIALSGEDANAYINSVMY